MKHTKSQSTIQVPVESNFHPKLLLKLNLEKWRGNSGSFRIYEINIRSKQKLKDTTREKKFLHG